MNHRFLPLAGKRDDIADQALLTSSFFDNLSHLEELYGLTTIHRMMDCFPLNLYIAFRNAQQAISLKNPELKLRLSLLDDGQELITDQWLGNNEVQLVDTFVDKGHSAKTFDRPDFIKLKAFVLKHHKGVDYLLVDQMDRFSRDAGEAMSMVKDLQKTYHIQIVSVSEGIIFDYDTPGSFFRAGLQFLLAEDDNINRSVKIRAGNYTARAKEGRYLSNLPPFGYRKVGEGKARTLEINEEEAPVVAFIFESYLHDVPLNIIRQEAAKLGYLRKGKMTIERVLKNPSYVGMVYAKAFKEHRGGLFPARHEPLIDLTTWELVQNKLRRPEKVRTLLDENIPLRGILKCHCG